MTTKLKLFFIAMDFLTLMVYPIMFVYGQVRQMVKPKALAVSVKAISGGAVV